MKDDKLIVSRMETPTFSNITVKMEPEQGDIHRDIVWAWLLMGLGVLFWAALLIGVAWWLWGVLTR